MIDPLVLLLWGLRLAFLALLWLVLLLVVRALLRDLRRTALEAPRPLARLLVLASPSGSPPVGSEIPIGAVTSLGPDPACTILVEDEALLEGAAVLAYRGSGWHLSTAAPEPRIRIAGRSAPEGGPLAIGDALELGGVRLRLEHAVEVPGG